MIHNLGKGKDKKEIELKIDYNDVSRETTVVVFKDETVLQQSFPANRFGFHLADSVKALQIADSLALQLENKLGI